MSFAHKIYPQHKTIVVKEDGAGDSRSVSASIKNLTSARDFDPHFHVIVDLRKIESNPPPSDLFSIKDVLITMKSNFLGGVTIVTTERLLFAVRIISTMAAVYNFNCSVVTKSELLDSLDNQPD